MGKYTINLGDSLSALAQRWKTTVQKIVEANADKIKDPNKITAGDTIDIPDSTDGATNSGFTYDPFEYADYTASDAVNKANTDAQAASDALKNYGNFSYANQGALNDALQNYLNRGDFSYDFNADALYQQYKDKYIQQGKMAMADTIGQASAMTGGYGNSYAATAGNQAYQAQLQNLNDIIPELYQMAYDRYNQQGQDMLNQYSLLSTDRDAQYGLWSDGYNRLASDRDYYASLYDSERAFDYGKYADDKAYAYQDHSDAIAYKQWREQMDFQKEQYKDSKIVSSSGGSSSGGSSGGSSSGSSGGSSSGGLSSVPSYITKKAESFESNTALASWLDGLALSGVLTQSQADQLYAQYADDNEKYVQKDDGSSSISFSDMVKSTSGWSVVDDGGINWFWGVDNNVILKAPNGEQIRLDNLVDKLVSEDMDKSDAKDYVKALQKNLGV